MTSKERMRRAMCGETPDRVPLMCQLALGHIYKHARLGPVDFWLTAEGAAEGYIRGAEMYHFDGILLNRWWGVDPQQAADVKSVEKTEDGHVITFANGGRAFCPYDDDPRSLDQPVPYEPVDVGTIDPDKIKCMGSEKDLPPGFFSILDCVMARKGDSLSIHGEVGTVFEDFVYRTAGSLEAGLIALVDHPERSKEIMDVMLGDTIIYSLAQCARGVDAFKLSSPFAGAGFISKGMYEEFVLPYEKRLISAIHEKYNIPCYIHTCGAIGDRLDLMLETGTDGLECLDPPPLGTVDLEQAIDQIGDNIFIKGNLDSVNELLGHSPDEVKEIARKRIEIGRRAKGFILSSACSVSPLVPPENIRALYDAVEEYGQFT